MRRNQREHVGDHDAACVFIKVDVAVDRQQDRHDRAQGADDDAFDDEGSPDEAVLGADVAHDRNLIRAGHDGQLDGVLDQEDGQQAQGRDQDAAAVADGVQGADQLGGALAAEVDLVDAGHLLDLVGDVLQLRTVADLDVEGVMHRVVVLEGLKHRLLLLVAEAVDVILELLVLGGIGDRLHARDVLDVQAELVLLIRGLMVIVDQNADLHALFDALGEAGHVGREDHEKADDDQRDGDRRSGRKRHGSVPADAVEAFLDGTPQSIDHAGRSLLPQDPRRYVRSRARSCACGACSRG